MNTIEVANPQSKIIEHLRSTFVQDILHPEWIKQQMPDSPQTVFDALKATALIASGYNNELAVKVLNEIDADGAATIDHIKVLNDQSTRFIRYCNLLRMFGLQTVDHAIHFIQNWPSKGTDTFREEQKP